MIQEGTSTLPDLPEVKIYRMLVTTSFLFKTTTHEVSPHFREQPEVGRSKTWIVGKEQF